MRLLYYIALFIGIFYLLKFVFRLLLLWFGLHMKKKLENQFGQQFHRQEDDDDDEEFTDFEEVE